MKRGESNRKRKRKREKGKFISTGWCSNIPAGGCSPPGE
jgi:hypothetical protein